MKQIIIEEYEVQAAHTYACPDKKMVKKMASS